MSARSPNVILVTGGAGFIGSAFVRHVLSIPEFTGRVVNYDALTYAGDLENVAGVAESARYVFVRGDVCDEALLGEVCDRQRVDTVVHFAAETHVDRSILAPAPFLRTNVEGTFRLLEVVRSRPHIHLHQVSTDEVYGSLDTSGRFDESSCYAPSSPYAASKAAADHLVRAYARTYRISATLSHCGNNYGPYQSIDKLVPLAIDALLGNRPIPIYGDGSNVRDWIHVDDHVEALWAIVLRGASGETYDISAGTERSNLQVVWRLVELVAEATSRPVEALRPLVTFVADRPGHDRRYALDAAKIQRALAWQPKREFDQGLRATLAWITEHPAWVDRARERLLGARV